MRSRLVQVLTLYWQPLDGSMPEVAVMRPHGRNLDTDAQPYQRLIAVGPEWQDLSFGWVERASLVDVEHVEPKHQGQPSESERKARAAVRVEVGVGVCAFASLAPGQGATFPAAPNAAYRIRSTVAARVKVTVFPG